MRRHQSCPDDTANVQWLLIAARRVLFALLLKVGDATRLIEHLIELHEVVVRSPECDALDTFAVQQRLMGGERGLFCLLALLQFGKQDCRVLPGEFKVG